jgi:hypothetical protein
MAYLFHYVAGWLAGLAAFGGYLLILYPFKPFVVGGPVFVFILAAVFLLFALWPWKAPANETKPFPTWKIIIPAVLFFLLFKVLIVVLLIAGQPR